ncbi:hypothetical protein LC087_15135 [Bacillus carboniphilus]|uniref:Uncharacterized protein n=1 Tax=Bacillus carboniphilus TaxID=86663 RepID=A0ABY9JRW6_9BACI|nr:hypothetical protein [Bacillus carboniphilus]WLR42087.1 hypothetical protein LC087_15135 [Bacillus carboniphilus]
MLSQKSEQFLVELKLHLMSKGKDEQQIVEVIEELEDHLMQAEAEGKSVDHIVGNSPKKYIKTISNELNTNLRQTIKYVLLAILYLVASSCFSSAIEGEFTLTAKNLSITGAGLFIGIPVLAWLYFKGIPKFYLSNWKFVFVSVFINMLLIAVFVGIHFIVEPFGDGIVYKGSTSFSYSIAILCVVIFILFAFIGKSWLLTAFIVYTISLNLNPLFVKHFSSSENEIALDIGYTLTLTALMGFVFGLYIYRDKKNSSV